MKITLPESLKLQITAKLSGFLQLLQRRSRNSGGLRGSFQGNIRRVARFANDIP